MRKARGANPMITTTPSQLRACAGHAARVYHPVIRRTNDFNHARNAPGVVAYVCSTARTERALARNASFRKALAVTRPGS